MSVLAVAPAPVRAPGPVAAPVGPVGPSRLLTGLSAAALVVVLAVNLPAFLRTALDCDPILFDLYVRDMGRGAVLYRDMLENNTPGMIGLHALVRAGFGWSSEALRVADLLVVGAGAALLALWSHRGRPDLRLLTFALLAVLYLSTTEWCHAQRDVWLLLPVMVGLYLRRARLGRPTTGVGLAVLEGAVWGLAVWVKPHVAVVAAVVWVAGAAWARARGATGRKLLADAAGVTAGGLLVGAAGVGVMAALGIWEPYLDHLTGWAGEYSRSDMYKPVGPWFYRLGFVLRNAPWSILYLAAAPVALGLAAGPLLGRAVGSRPDRVILAAALAGWAAQAWFLQHVFDYPHVGGMMLAAALMTDLAAGLPTAGFRRAGLGTLVGLTAVGHAALFRDRVAVWSECAGLDGGRPAVRDQLGRYGRIKWADLEQVTDFLRSQDVRDGELVVASDTALPLWQMTGLRPPTRYYIVHNNLLAFPSHRAEILGAIGSNPRQRFLVCDLTALRWDEPSGRDWRHPEAWPIPADWYGPRRWADRIVFRAGRYVVLSMPAADVPTWLDDVTEI